jgi:hypothetical protein
MTKDMIGVTAFLVFTNCCIQLFCCVLPTQVLERQSIYSYNIKIFKSILLRLFLSYKQY